jgi:ribosomal protein S18 acetylase RimI-like enzyme
MPASIRAATVDDARAIAEIHVAGWRAAYRGQMPDALLDSLSVDARTGKWRGWLAQPATPDHRTWVAEAGGRIAGFSNTGPARGADGRPGAAEVYAIYLDPAQWGRGIGRDLLAFTVGDLRRRGRTEVSLWVLAGNARARRFYEIAGFAADGTEKSEIFGGAPLTEVRYLLRL